MTPEFNGWEALTKFAEALSIVAGAMAWHRKGSLEEDQVVSESIDVLLEGVSDADSVNKIDLHTGRNIREQLTVEQAEEMAREKELRRFGRRN